MLKLKHMANNLYHISDLKSGIPYLLTLSVHVGFAESIYSVWVLSSF